MPKIWTLQETADHFKVTVRCINKWCNEGKLERKKFGGVVRITEASILAFYESSY
jgi:hypothetical protein